MIIIHHHILHQPTDSRIATLTAIALSAVLSEVVGSWAYDGCLQWIQIVYPIDTHFQTASRERPPVKASGYG